MALAYGYVHRHHAPGQRFEGMCNISIHRPLVVTQDVFLCNQVLCKVNHIHVDCLYTAFLSFIYILRLGLSTSL
jgi:hypothetical protein